MQFVPLWTDILDTPNWKILDLPAEIFRFWTLCLLAAQKHDFVEGFLPDERTLACWFGMGRDNVVTCRDIAVTCHVLDRDIDGRYKIHDWEHWRDPKNSGATARKRKQRRKEKELRAKKLEENGELSPDMSREGHGVSRDVTLQHTTNNSQQTTNTHPPTPSRGGGVGVGLEPSPEPIPEEDPATAEKNSEVARVANLAADAWGNISWSTWVCQRVRLGDPPELLEAAIREAVDSRVQSPSPKYVAAIVERLRVNGIPRRPVTLTLTPAKSEAERAAEAARDAELVKRTAERRRAYDARIAAEKSERRSHEQARG